MARPDPRPHRVRPEAITTQWPRVRAIFDAAVAMPIEARAAFLDRLGPADAQLRRDVEDMLRADARDDDFLRPPAFTAAAPSLVGRQIGAFRVVRPIASGGMGTVWEAEQDEPRRRVALKTMHVGHASESLQRRFRFEAELLATLRHPGIAQVYGAGVLDAEDGGPSLPWFALEFVDGARGLIRYAQDEHLDLPSRLRLFQTLCSAVQHAHQRGVIHRDLKSANVLVDRDGHLRVIDFGIARLVDREARAGAIAETIAGEVVGTLGAMSPEQVEGRTDEVDARTDVYALGVILYELAAGQPPHRFDGVSLHEAVRRIRDVEPPPPSRFAPQLPREIDWIVATAMAKEPSRRYQAASDIALEIQRLLAREPVLAGPPSSTYRLRKFCQRHRAGVAASCLAVVAGLVGVAGAAYGFVKQQRLLVAEASARADADVAERFSRWFGGLFEGLMPDVVDGRPPSRDELLARGAAWVRAELQDRPLLQARLMRSIGHVHGGFGQYDEARSALDEAVRLCRTQGVPGERDLVEGLTRLGQVCRQLADVHAAEAALREALAIEERLTGADQAKLGPILNELGVLLAESRPTEALDFYRRTYALEVAHHGADSGDAAIVLANIGNLELRARRFDAARDTLERALPILIDRHGEGDPRVASLIGSLAIAYRSLGEFGKALELQRRDIELSTRALDPGHPDLGVARIHLARTLEALGDAAGALAEAERGAEILERNFAPSHPTRIAGATTRAHLLVLSRRYDAARAALEPIVALGDIAEPARAAQGAAMLVLADLERRAGDPDRALALAERVLADPICRKDATLISNAHWTRAVVFTNRADPPRAEVARQDALAALPTLSERAPNALAEARLAAVAGDPQRAIRILETAVAAGYRSAQVLIDPDFAEVRARPDFAPIEAALTQRAGR